MNEQWLVNCFWSCCFALEKRSYCITHSGSSCFSFERTEMHPQTWVVLHRNCFAQWLSEYDPRNPADLVDVYGKSARTKLFIILLMQGCPLPFLVYIDICFHGARPVASAHSLWHLGRNRIRVWCVLHCPDCLKERKKFQLNVLRF